MTYEQACNIYEAIEATQHEVRVDLYRLAIRYSAIRAEWILSDSRERQEMDDQRTACHNALIDALNILTRNLAKEGRDVSWRAGIGEDRKDIGDFAVFLAASLAIQAR
ncbi:MAG: hypothetical protein H7A46_23560 [Verrucomicrobiales bacterium]|nr:hypothetical protein [Verrucomicrobiales bacterium]